MKSELIELVKKEAANLKVNATKEEINKLDFYTFEGRSVSRCIYGQMTGDCYSSRASELILECCERVYEPNKNDRDSLSTKLNGAPFKLNNPSDREEKYFSPIEVYIYSKSKNIALPIIQYLKGEAETLDI